VRSQVLVSLLVSGVLGDEMEVFSADDKGTVHLGGNNGASQDTATDGDETGEGALLVCGRRGSAFYSSFECAVSRSRCELEAQISNQSLPSHEPHLCPYFDPNIPSQIAESHVPM
jgi:hypothetical protein